MPETHMPQLDSVARDMAERALAWMDGGWDPAAGLFRMPDGAFYEDGRLGVPVHMVRESAWYALGLLLRDAPGDSTRACKAIGALLGYQFDAPGQPFHGTWRRSPHEPDPPPEPVVWRDYDPNWREFIGTTLALALLEYEPQLPAALVGRIDAALERAIAGTLARNVPASYTNIALMTVFLLQYGAARFGQPAWGAVAERLAGEIGQRFWANGSFDEYNSPTYYAVDLYALALWRSYAFDPALREAGAAIEAALWHDIAQFYHPGMRNLAGPYDRSYGMDMRQYVAGLGLWIWLTTGYDRAPFPRLDQPFEHAWDFAKAPVVALLGARVPADARAHLLAFAGDHTVERIIAAEPRRVASAWLGARAMLGAEDSSSSHRVSEQFHPATLHWLIDDERVGWVRLGHTLPVDAWAAPGRLTIECTRHGGGDLAFVFQLAAPGASLAGLRADCWELPGLTLRVETDAAFQPPTRAGELIELRYELPGSQPDAPVLFTLEIEQG